MALTVSFRLQLAAIAFVLNNSGALLSSMYVEGSGQHYAQLGCASAFPLLNEKEQNHAHSLARAAWYGTFITALQISPESINLMVLIIKVLQLDSDSKALRNYLLSFAGFSAKEVDAIFEYFSAVLHHHGNYESWENIKFYPDVNITKLQKLVILAYPNQTSWHRFHDHFTLKPAYDKGVEQSGFPPDGQNRFYKYMSQEQAESANRFLVKESIQPGNQIMSTSDNETLQVTYASVDKSDIFNEPDLPSLKLGTYREKFENWASVTVSRGVFSEHLRLVVNNMMRARTNSQSSFGYNMLGENIRYLETGSIAAHIKSGLHWIKDTKIAVDMYIGFVETYNDPLGMQALFQSTIVLKDAQDSVSFKKLTDSQDMLKKRLPWTASFDETPGETSFASVASLAFTSPLARGINLPNYPEVKKFGSKNLNLINVVQAKAKHMSIAFFEEPEANLARTRYIESFRLRVGIHELIGHGTGKFFRVYANGSTNFAPDTIDPTTGERVASWYTDGESFASKFSESAAAYEETRADGIAHYLACEEEVLGFFNVSAKEEVCTSLWLNLIYSGFTAIRHHRDGKWLAAHSQASYVLLRVILEAEPSLLTIEEYNGPMGTDLRFKVNRALLNNNTKNLLIYFLLKLHVYRCTGCLIGITLLNKYSEIPSQWEQYKKIVQVKTANDVEPLMVQPNTFLGYSDSTVTYKDYEASAEGMLDSWRERFSLKEIDALETLAFREVEV